MPLRPRSRTIIRPIGVSMPRTTVGMPGTAGLCAISGGMRVRPFGRAAGAGQCLAQITHGLALPYDTGVEVSIAMDERIMQVRHQRVASHARNADIDIVAGTELAVVGAPAALFRGGAAGTGAGFRWPVRADQARHHVCHSGGRSRLFIHACHGRGRASSGRLYGSPPAPPYAAARATGSP